MLNTVLCSWVVKRTEVFFQCIIAASIMGKLASNPGMFWILCASHKQFNLLASIVKKRMRKPWGQSRARSINPREGIWWGTTADSSDPGQSSESFWLSPKKTQKTKPLKKLPQTDAIFENVLRENQASDQNLKSLRLSIDTKAKVKIGNLSRGGKARCLEPNAADDHDTDWQAVLVPFGISNSKFDTIWVFQRFLLRLVSISSVCSIELTNQRKFAS